MQVLDLETRIEPFGDRVVDLPCLDLPFGSFRARECQGLDTERLTFADYAIATRPILADLLSKAPRTSPGRLALPRTSSSRSLTPVSSVDRAGEIHAYDIFVDAPPDLPLDELRRIARPIIVDLPAKTIRRELPRVGPPPHHLDLPDDGVVAAHVEHWVHMLWLWPLLVPALCLHRPGKRRRWRGAPSSFIGEDASIHHRARLERAVIGEGAQVGSDAAILSSYVGAKASIADFTKITRSVLGERTHTLADASLSSAVSLGDGTLANLLLRDTILGKNVFLTSGVIFWNEAIEGTVRVLHRGALADSERRNLGGCAGHGSILGARTIVAPGRALPNRTTVVMRREEGVMRIEDTRGDPVCWHDGALIPVDRVEPGYRPDEVRP